MCTFVIWQQLKWRAAHLLTNFSVNSQAGAVNVKATDTVEVRTQVPSHFFVVQWFTIVFANANKLLCILMCSIMFGFREKCIFN